MSGYNPETGLYDLTATKAYYWSDVDESMDYYTPYVSWSSKKEGETAK